MPLPRKGYLTLPEIIERWSRKHRLGVRLEDFRHYIGLPQDDKLMPWVLLNRHVCAAMGGQTGDLVLGYERRVGIYRVFHPMFVTDYFAQPFVGANLFLQPKPSDRRAVKGLFCWQVWLEKTQDEWGAATLRECLPELIFPIAVLEQFEAVHLADSGSPQRPTRSSFQTWSKAATDARYHRHRALLEQALNVARDKWTAGSEYNHAEMTAYLQDEHATARGELPFMGLSTLALRKALASVARELGKPVKGDRKN